MGLLSKLTRLPGIRSIWLRLGAGSVEQRLEFDIWERPRLSPATKLVLGNVDETTEQFARPTRSPIGFIAFDMDYYSSTVQSFRIFAAGPESRLPRVYCYFDDLVWPEEAPGAHPVPDSPIQAN